MKRYGNGSAVAMAMQNFIELSRNPYPGRGIITGVSSDSAYLVQVYWIEGRSDNSRNRVFSIEGGRVFTEAADPAKVKDGSLIFYNAMDEYDGNYVVSNGDQTDDVMKMLRRSAGIRLHDALLGRFHEPDKPNFTPRITGLSRINPGKDMNELSILRKSDLADCERAYIVYNRTTAGFGFCVTTYDGDDDPLPSFEGGPYPLPILGSVNDVAETYWSILDKMNRVAIAVKFISISTGESKIRVINQNTKKVPPNPPTAQV